VFLPGGMLIPLELLPRPLELISFALPFATMAYVPGRIASGHPIRCCCSGSWAGWPRCWRWPEPSSPPASGGCR
jgi:hypothetical protein